MNKYFLFVYYKTIYLPNIYLLIIVSKPIKGHTEVCYNGVFAKLLFYRIVFNELNLYRLSL